MVAAVPTECEMVLGGKNSRNKMEKLFQDVDEDGEG